MIHEQITEEVNSDPHGINNTENTELQLIHVNCESTDSGSDTENPISINKINVENDYKPLIYEQPFHSHIYENQTELQNCYTRPINNNKTIEQIVDEVTEKKTCRIFKYKSHL